MCCFSCLSQKVLRTLHFTLSIILTIIIIALVVLILLKSNIKNFTFQWTPILISMICILCFIVILLLIGGFGLCYRSKFCYSIFFILILCTVLLFLGLGIFCLVNSSTAFVSKTFGCETENQSLNSTYSNYDRYLQEVDKVFCSSNCVCSLYNYKNFTEVQQTNENKNNKYSEVDSRGDYSLEFSLSTWDFDEKTGKPTAFTNCTANAQELAKNNFRSKYNSNMTDKDISDFTSWYTLLEVNFNCVGICNTKYVVNGFRRRMNKFLFTDINRGPPDYFGCIDSIAEWVPSQLLIVGFVCLGLVIVSSIILWLTGILVFGNNKDEENK